MNIALGNGVFIFFDTMGIPANSCKKRNGACKVLINYFGDSYKKYNFAAEKKTEHESESGKCLIYRGFRIVLILWFFAYRNQINLCQRLSN